jgi:hypothetical protein
MRYAPSGARLGLKEVERMKLTLASGGPHTLPINLVLLTVAVLLMLVGAALLVADVGSAGIWIPVIAIGIALTVIVQRGRRR